jgi:DNA-binding transcriptional LysR family regulator
VIYAASPPAGAAAIGHMVQDGIGVAILPESTIAALGGPELRAIPLSDAWARRRLALCLRRADMLTPQARLLADHIKSAAAPVL